MSNCCRWNRVFLWISAVICLLAAVAAQAKPKVQSTTESTIAGSGENRTLTFDKGASIGRLSLIPRKYQSLNDETPIGAASGQVNVRVPRNMWLQLELSRQALTHPDQLNLCPAAGVDAVKINFIALDDSESMWCDALLKHVNHFKNLHCLILDKSDVTDAGLSALSGLPEIECISLFMTGINGSCFKSFGQFKKLRYLNLTGAPLQGENLKYLSNCPDLFDIDLHRTGLGEVGVRYLSRCANLEYVRLADNANVNDSCIKYLLNLKQAKTITLESTSVSCHGVQALKALNLAKLSVSEGLCDKKERSALHAIAKSVDEYPRTRTVTRETEHLFAPMH